MRVFEIKSMGSLCALESFKLNGDYVQPEDFGDQYDHSPEDAEDYACGNMKFTRRDSTPEVLAKYQITEEEYDQIASKLETELSFGSCGWCV